MTRDRMFPEQAGFNASTSGLSRSAAWHRKPPMPVCSVAQHQRVAFVEGLISLTDAREEGSSSRLLADGAGYKYCPRKDWVIAIGI